MISDTAKPAKDAKSSAASSVYRVVEGAAEAYDELTSGRAA